MFHCTDDDDRMKRWFNFNADRPASFVSKAWMKHWQVYLPSFLSLVALFEQHLCASSSFGVL